MFSHPDYDGHEALLFAQDTASGLRALIAIHDTTLGPAFGGCRMYPYASEQHAMTDALRLSRGMTYKAAICELPYGGGKSVIIADPGRDKTPALLHAMGRIVEGLGGHYIAADDVGTTLADLVMMREVTRYTAAATTAAQRTRCRVPPTLRRAARTHALARISGHHALHRASSFPNLERTARGGAVREPILPPLCRCADRRHQGEAGCRASPPWQADRLRA